MRLIDADALLETMKEYLSEQEKDNMRDDLISRKDALDAIVKKFNDRPLDSDRWAIVDIGTAIKALPSAQIQRIVLTDDEKEALIKGIVDTLIKKIKRCKDCKWVSNYGENGRILVCLNQHRIVYEDDRCSEWEECGDE